MVKSAKRKAAAEKHLPKNAPRKSGKRGISAPPEETEQAMLMSTAQEEQLGSSIAEEQGKRKPRQPRLPGTEDPEIEELEAAAEEYAGIRDQRMALTPEETRLKGVLLAMMKSHKKTVYNHGSIEIKVVTEKETVKVKLKKEEE